MHISSRFSFNINGPAHAAHRIYQPDLICFCQVGSEQCTLDRFTPLQKLLAHDPGKQPGIELRGHHSSVYPEQEAVIAPLCQFTSLVEKNNFINAWPLCPGGIQQVATGRLVKTEDICRVDPPVAYDKFQQRI